MTLSTHDELAVFRRRKVKLRMTDGQIFMFYPTPDDPQPLPTDDIFDFLTIEVLPELSKANYRLTIGNITLESNDLPALEDVLCCWANSENYFPS
jgi:hypothetical protein